MESLRRQIYGIASGRRDIEFSFLRNFSPPDSGRVRDLYLTLNTALELPETRLSDTPLRWVKNLLGYWEDRSRPVVVVLPLFGDHAGRTFSHLQELLDLLRKESANRLDSGEFMPHRGMLWIGIGEARDDFGSQQFYDFTSGIPDCADFSGVKIRGSRLWRDYVMLRTAWETAGCPHLYDWNAASAIVDRRDDELEKWFNQQAVEAYERLIGRVDSESIAWLERLMPQSAGSTGMADQLHRYHALWRPPGENHLQPAPWVARKWLNHDRNHRLRLQLLHALVCRPLSEKLLSLCLSLEARFRLYVDSHHSLASALPETPSQDFRAQESWYPGTHPALPLRSEEYSVFGTIVTTLKGENHVHRLADLTRLLRNYLAHNHYVCWSTIEKYQFLDKSCRSVV